MAQTQTQPVLKKSRRRLVLAIVLVVIIAGAAASFLFYRPATLQLSIRDPPQAAYDSSIQAIYVTFTSIEVHTANAGDNSGWHTVTNSATVNLLTVLNVSSTLGKSSVPAGRYTELRFNVSQVVVTISGVNVTYSIPSGSLKVPILNGGLQVYGALTASVELDLSFNNSEILSMSGHLTPVATARVT